MLHIEKRAVRRMLSMALAVATGLVAGPAVAEPAPPARLPTVVSAVSIIANGARGDDVSGEETAAACARFRLRASDVRSYLRLARPVEARAYHHDLEMSRCHAEGSVTFADGHRGRWRIDRERRGIVLVPGSEPVFLYCPRCTARAFEPVYDPERDG